MFFFVLIVTLFIQLIALPYLLPTWHGGNGLLQGGDWLAYHELALDLSDKVRTEGWSVWELRPEEQAPAGIAAAIYSLTGIQKPWTVLPLNAALHATATLILLLIMKKLSGRITLAFWAVIPFALSPTPFLWNAALHKDGFFIAGSFLAIYGFMYFSNMQENNKYKPLLLGAIFFITGIILIWVVRPYGTEMMLYIAICLALPLTAFLLAHVKKRHFIVLNVAVLWICIILMLPLTETGVYTQYVDTSLVSSGTITARINLLTNKAEAAAAATANIESENQVAGNNPAWCPTSYLPLTIEKTFYTLSVMRDRYRTHKPYALSNIDTDVQFTSAVDILTYIPRAFQIGLFAPFPNYWFEKGHLGSTTFMRRYAALEMIIIYIFLAFSVAAFWFWRKKPDTYIVYGFALGMILTYSLVVVNIGTLYRMRYGFIMTLVACGVAAFVTFLERRKGQNQDIQND